MSDSEETDDEGTDDENTFEACGGYQNIVDLRFTILEEKLKTAKTALKDCKTKLAAETAAVTSLREKCKNLRLEAKESFDMAALEARKDCDAKLAAEVKELLAKCKNERPSLLKTAVDLKYVLSLMLVLAIIHQTFPALQKFVPIIDKTADAYILDMERKWWRTLLTGLGPAVAAVLGSISIPLMQQSMRTGLTGGPLLDLAARGSEAQLTDVTTDVTTDDDSFTTDDDSLIELIALLAPRAIEMLNGLQQKSINPPSLHEAAIGTNTLLHKLKQETTSNADVGYANEKLLSAVRTVRKLGNKPVEVVEELSIKFGLSTDGLFQTQEGLAQLRATAELKKQGIELRAVQGGGKLGSEAAVYEYAGVLEGRAYVDTLHTLCMLDVFSIILAVWHTARRAETNILKLTAVFSSSEVQTAVAFCIQQLLAYERSDARDTGDQYKKEGGTEVNLSTKPIDSYLEEATDFIAQIADVATLALSMESATTRSKD
jgi:hypothetical protein